MGGYQGILMYLTHLDKVVNCKLFNQIETRFHSILGKCLDTITSMISLIKSHKPISFEFQEDKRLIRSLRVDRQKIA